MACKTSYELHHNFSKIADEAGFAFNTHRPRVHIDWNKIRLIDVENLIRERKFVLIEQHLNDILDCILESEFDVRILDEGVIKMFRLAQLSVEYQQFCRHYLDRSVYVLREEINSLAQELDVAKNELKERDDEIRKLKRKTRHSFRPTLPYGNDNIASMILKTLNNKNEFHTSSTGEALQYNKCKYCDKVFLNQLYLKSHISRRHAHFTDIPQKDVEENVQIDLHVAENNKLKDELSELKMKVEEMENNIKNVKTQDRPDNAMGITSKDIHLTAQTEKKSTKDAEVITESEVNVLDKIEEWKKEEQSKYNKEINSLRNQIMETIQNLKEKDSRSNNDEDQIIKQLNATITKQGSEIEALKQELFNSRHHIEKKEAERQKNNEVQTLQWINRADTYAKQYETLLQKLNEVANDAKESRAQTELEKERVAQLEAMLQKSLKERNVHQWNSETNEEIKKEIARPTPKKKSYTTSPDANRQTLEKLHQKAQDLLQIGSSSYSSSDASSIENNTVVKVKKHTKNKVPIKLHIPKFEEEKKINSKKPTNETSSHLQGSKSKETSKLKEQKGKHRKTKTVHQNSLKVENNGPIVVLRSPEKVLRSKIIEEVHRRLTTAGIDPLTNGVSQQNYKKQRMQLQQKVELKYKRNPSHEKVRHSILAHLDSSLPKKLTAPPLDYVSPGKISKAFSLTSVISNVKSKAMSLVKSNDINSKDKRKILNAEISKRAMSLIKTPPSSSPISKDHRVIDSASRVEKNPRVFLSEKNKSEDEIHSDVTSDEDSAIDSNQSNHKYYKTNSQQTSKSIENLIKSPARRPLSANSNVTNSIRKYTIQEENIHRSQSDTDILNDKPAIMSNNNLPAKENTDNSSNTESSENIAIQVGTQKDNSDNPKQTKSVLKNASSTSSLNKKKVLFDMDAIQMKSLSASPSQSITEKSDSNEKFELGLVNLDGEEWDISSIDNEPLQNDTKIQINRTSPKIAELKHTIESQLARRNETPTAAIVGGVDLLGGATTLRASSVGGSNTSLGSSILDESENMPPVVNHRAFVKPKHIAHKDDSEIDISEFSDGNVIHKTDNDTF